MKNILSQICKTLPEFAEVLPYVEVTLPESRAELLQLAYPVKKGLFTVKYTISDNQEIIEATVALCKNGVAVNFPEPYMRRRDPHAMFIADDFPTDKTRFADKFGEEFTTLRNETFAWLKAQQRLIVLPFMSGGKSHGYPTLLVAPENTGFFVTALADLQGFIPGSKLTDSFIPQAVIYLAPPFRHTHFDGKQVVVHNRQAKVHELFSYNLYPGPCAKKGVYGILLSFGEKEGWPTLHSSAVRLITPYDNAFVIMHEGASGGGKSEMTQALHREEDGRILFAESIKTGDDFYLEMLDNCELQPAADDMALAHPDMQGAGKGKLVIEDAEAGWFLRVDHLTEYGTEPHLEKLFIKPKEPLIFLNIDAAPGSTALPWEHIEDEPGKPCPNPRVIVPRAHIPRAVDGALMVDVRSFGVRTPPCTIEKPNYGIIGLFHVLPPALAWLWRLTAPRGHSNPSIVTAEGLSSEGVGSYWPFATGKKAEHANLLLRSIQATPATRYLLIPNQYIGAYSVGFQPEWITREYIARRGNARFTEVIESRCPLLGYCLPRVRVNGQLIPRGLLQVQEQVEVGIACYDRGAEILTTFFKQELAKYNSDEIDPLGRVIIDICMNDGTVSDYAQVLPD